MNGPLMVDTHCHLLPALDDGPATEAEAVELARRLLHDGVSFVLCTPHFSQRYPTDHDLALGRLRALSDAMSARGFMLEMAVAAEVSPAYAVSAPLAHLGARSISARFVLVEVQPDTPTSFFPSVEARLAEAGLQPIFAHPERSQAVQRRPSCLDEARRNGSLIQVVAPSLVGLWGHGASTTAWRLVESGRADLVASDAHNLHRRPSYLRAAASLIARRFGDRAASELTMRNPASVFGRTTPS